MQEHAAVFRDGPTLQEGVRKMKDLYKQLDDLKVKYVLSYKSLFFRESCGHFGTYP